MSSRSFVTSPQHGITCGIVDRQSSIDSALVDVRVLRSPNIGLLNKHFKMPKRKLHNFTDFPVYKVGDSVVKAELPVTFNGAHKYFIRGIIVETYYLDSIQYLSIKITESEKPEYVGRVMQGVAWWCFEVETQRHPACGTLAPVWSMFEG